jgi:hypothetical protein
MPGEVSGSWWVIGSSRLGDVRFRVVAAVSAVSMGEN